MTLAGGLGALLLHRLDGAGACVVAGADLLLAGGCGHSGTLGEPYGAGNGQTRRETFGSSEAEVDPMDGLGTGAGTAELD